MTILIILSPLIVAALYIAMVKGWLAYLWVFLTVFVSVILDLGCQLWIDLCGIFRKKVKLDESEKFYHD